MEDAIGCSLIFLINMMTNQCLQQTFEEFSQDRNPTLRNFSVLVNCSSIYPNNPVVAEAGSTFVQAPCQEQGSLQQLAQDSIQSCFVDLQGWRLHNLSRQPVAFVPLFDKPHCKTVCLCVLKGLTEFPVFQLVPVASCPVSMDHKRTRLHQLFIHFVKILS